MSCSQTTIKQVQIFFLPPRLIKQLSLIVCIRVHKADHQTIHQHKNENLTWFWRNTGTMMRFFWRPFWGLVSCRLSSGVFTAGIASWDVPRVFIYELASSVTSSCLLSSAASGWCWRKREALNLYMNYTDPPLTIQKAAFTCLRKIRWSRLRLGLSGDWHLSRSGERDPSAPKTFSSSKHPVSIIYRRGQLRFCWG